jgi:hypothetical protein
MAATGPTLLPGEVLDGLEVRTQAEKGRFYVATRNIERERVRIRPEALRHTPRAPRPAQRAR